MKNVYRVFSVILCISLFSTCVISQAGKQKKQAAYSILSTMSGSTDTGVQAEEGTDAETLSTEPYFKNQWALYNDGTFKVKSGYSVPSIEMPNIMPAPIDTGNGDGYQNRPDNNISNRLNGRIKFNFWHQGQSGGWSITIGYNKAFSTYNRMFTSKITAVEDIDIDAPEASLVVNSNNNQRDVIVAVIDTGVDYTHEDLSDAVWINEGETAGDGIDNDGNGYIDDVYGWDFYNDKPYEIDKAASENDHATHVAGTIAASMNGVGIAGINANGKVKIMSLKVLGGSEGSGNTEAVVKAIRYAQKMGVSICNLSFGTNYYDKDLEAAMKESKMLFVCAAGNASGINTGDDTDNEPVYPADFDLDNIISVANLTFDGTLDSTSDYGKDSVDIAAPGTYIFSTLSDNSYGYMSGTSMAAPMVTAVAAMVYSNNTDASLSDVKNIVLSSAQKLASLDGKVATGGMLNAYNAVTTDK